MINHKRNCKTLIICFVIALFALVPLRFIEEGNKLSYTPRNQVLGEEVVLIDKKPIVDEVEIEAEVENEIKDEIEGEDEVVIVKEEKQMEIILPDSDIEYLIERVY